MDEPVNDVGKFLLSDEESKSNNTLQFQEESHNNLFQYGYQKYYYQHFQDNQNISLIDEEQLYESPNPEEKYAELNTIIPNIIDNQRSDASFNEINKIQIIGHTKSTTFITKKRGRKNVKSNEKGVHTKYFPDNRRESYWRLFMSYILMLANSFSCPYKMDSPNFIQQYGGNSIVENEKFLKVKIYQYFSYNTFFNDGKNHRKIGDRNLEIIKKMVFEQKNQTYIAIMKSTIEELFEIFKNNKKYITKNGRIYDLPNFKTIDDAFIEIQNNLEKDNILSADQIQDELNRVITLVHYIKIKGKEIKRKINASNKINYIKITELED